jgi:hypothetical protein
MRPKQVRGCEVKQIPICEKLERQAVSASRAHKMLAQAKTARQTDGGEYGWISPEQTLPAEAAAIIRDLVGALEKARDRFTEYASQHQQKAFATTVDRERDERMTKADSNLDMALMCDRALTRAQMQP